MDQLAHRFKGLSDPTRLRIIRLLTHGELCVCDLMAGLDLPQSTVSRHMSFLKNSGWASGRRKGKWVYYTLVTPTDEVHSLMLQVLRQSLPSLREAREDYGRLVNHLATKTAENCATA